MNSTTVVEAIIGLFLVGFGIYQLVTKTLVTGARDGRVQHEKASPLLYVFAPLEIVVGILAFGHVGVAVLRSATLAGSCNHRPSLLECTEFHGSKWDAAAMRGECPDVAVSDATCADDNLLGRCTSSDSAGRERVTHFYSGFVNHNDGIWEPTQETQAATCAARGGAWKPFP